MIHLIKEIKDVRPYTLTLRYNSGEIFWVDQIQPLQPHGLHGPCRRADIAGVGGMAKHHAHII